MIDAISVSDVIAIASLLLINITAIIISWKNTQVKLKEIDVRMENIKLDLSHHIEWGMGEQINNLKKFKEIETDNKIEHKEILVKMDVLLEKLTSFQLEVTRNYPSKNE